MFLNAALVPLNSLLAPLASEVFHSGTESISVLNIAIMGGQIVGMTFYPLVRQKFTLRGKNLLGVGVIYFGVYHILLIALQVFYDNRIFLYIFLTVATAIAGVLLAMMSSFMNIELIKQIDERYMARVSAFSTSLCSAAMPVMSFVISGIVALVGVGAVFVAAGALCVILGVPLFFTRILNVTDIQPGDVPSSETSETVAV